MSSPFVRPQRLRAGILGATGMVGQRFITLLQDHPLFAIHALGASPRSAGKKYIDAVHWSQVEACPIFVEGMVVLPCEASRFTDCDVVFSGLDASVAGDVEEEFFRADIPVLSNAKNHRYTPTVPLVVPLVNPGHLALIPAQRKANNLKRGFLLTNANCATTGLVVVLSALQEAFGPISEVNVVTLQAISGAGYPGCSALDLIDNIVPFISGEEDKMETEASKILGSVSADAATILPSTSLRVSATCTRVPVSDGHTGIASIKFARQPPPSPEQIIQALATYAPPTPYNAACPSAPSPPIQVLAAQDRPQPRLDRGAQEGYTVSVGRVRACPLFDTKLVFLSHNTVLGAAGSSVLNAEIAASMGYL